MVIKNAAIEIGRRSKQAITIGPHSGRWIVYQPFQGDVPDGKLFTPESSAEKLMEVLESLGPEQSGKCCAWVGKGVES
jgi:hypothetical protein